MFFTHIKKKDTYSENCQRILLSFKKDKVETAIFIMIESGFDENLLLLDCGKSVFKGNLTLTKKGDNLLK